MHETIEWSILNDGYLPTETEVISLARELWDLKKGDKK